MYSTYNENMLTKTHKVIKKTVSQLKSKKYKLLENIDLGIPSPQRK